MDDQKWYSCQVCIFIRAQITHKISGENKTERRGQGIGKATSLEWTKSERKSQIWFWWCEQEKDVLLSSCRLHPWVKGCLACYSQRKRQLEMSYVTLSPATVLESESILSCKV